MPVDNNTSFFTPQYNLPQPTRANPSKDSTSLPDELFDSQAAQDLKRVFPKGVPDSFYEDQATVEVYGPPAPGEEQDYEPNQFNFDFNFEPEGLEYDPEFDNAPVLYDLNDPRHPNNGGSQDPNYDRYQKATKREFVDNLRTGLREQLGQRGATVVEAGVGLAHIATGGKVKHSFDTSGFIPRSKLSISASVEGEAQVRFRVALGGGSR